MTNYNTLGELIKRYNGVVEGDHPELQVDLSVVKVRDAFGHGRSASLDQTKPNFLLKFDKPTKGIARVDFIEQLTPEWLDSQAKRVAQEAKKVVNALNMLGLA